jgi:hypothetical protein
MKSERQEEQNKAPEALNTINMQAELPMMGTPLNPIETEWVFDEDPGAAPPEQLAGSMPQGE